MSEPTFHEWLAIQRLYKGTKNGFTKTRKLDGTSGSVASIVQKFATVSSSSDSIHDDLSSLKNTSRQVDDTIPVIANGLDWLIGLVDWIG